MFYYVSPYALTKGSDDSRCWDVRTMVNLTIHPNQTVLIPTGIYYRVPPANRGRFDITLRPRSGLSTKGVMLLGGELDSDYVNEIKVILHNLSKVDVQFDLLDRIAQLKLCFNGDFNVPIAKVEVLPDFTTTRMGGFGSTGLK